MNSANMTAADVLATARRIERTTAKMDVPLFIGTSVVNHTVNGYAHRKIAIGKKFSSKSREIRV